MLAAGLYISITFLFQGIISSPNIDRVKAYSVEINQVLVDKILTEFTAVDVLEEKYSTLNLKSNLIKPSKLVHEKAGILQKILKSREDLVQRIAREAELLRKRDVPDDINSQVLTFYEENVEDQSTENETETGDNLVTKLYRNAKCGCGYQLPEEVESKTCILAENGYERNPQFGRQPVAYETSAVHIPTEVYNQDPEVLKDIYLSQELSNIFRSEVCSNGSDSHLTRWVYFTTQRGVMRYFPDRAWTADCETPDVYDSRISPWYIQSVSSPKDVTILIDNSGSIKGLTLNLFYRMVRHFLETLSANDFVNIVLFNERANYIEDRCTDLMQATPRNKQILNRWMENIHTENLSSVEAGFDLALRTLNQSTGSPRANCNPIVVLFTDGGATYPGAALKRWNPKGEKRIFTYAVGKNFYTVQDTKNIACNSRGNFNTIRSYTATKSEVQSYLTKISEPLVYRRKRKTKWTLPYRDQLGLGSMISASAPVYEDDEASIGKSVGVVGTDVLLDDLKKAVTDPEMGPDFYPFVIDNNGFAIFHPGLDEEAHDDVMTMDITDLEHENVIQMRKDMIDQRPDTREIQKEFIFDGRYQATAKYTYSYAPINGTVFSLGLAVHSSKIMDHNSGQALADHYPNLTMENLEGEMSSDSISLVYSSMCKNRERVSYNPCNVGEMENNTSENVYEEGITMQQLANIKCERSGQLQSDLLLHSMLSEDIASTNWDENSTVKAGDGVLSIFTAVEKPSFLRFKFFNFYNQTDGALDKETLDEDIEQEITQILSDPGRSTYLRRAIHQPQWTIYSYVEAPALPSPPVYYATGSQSNSTSMPTGTPPPVAGTTVHPTATSPFLSEMRRGYILASQAVQVSKSDPDVTTVVTGVVMHPDTFMDNLFNLKYKCNGTMNCSFESADLVCSDPENTACMILDDGGFLILSNQEEHIDKMNNFFGLVDGEFMRSLINEGVYSARHVYNHQAICKNTVSDSSAGMPRYCVPTVADILSLGWWLTSCAQMFVHTFVQSVLVTLWSFFEAGHAHSSVSTGIDLPTKREQCIMRSTVLSFGPNSPMLYGSFTCTEICLRTFTSVRLKDTNLLLIVADAVAKCREDCSTNAVFSNEAVDVTYDEICANRTRRYRKQPDENCYDASVMPKELDSDCSSTISVLPHLGTIAIFVFLRFILVRYSTL